jgi:YidC/Oxa1 family membrane protein insertase
LSLDWIYTGISWILLTWHTVWDAILPSATFLGTNWEWILAIVFLVVTLRIILFPVFVKQIKSQRAMQSLSPQIKALQEKHKGDRETLQKEMMELYRKEKANPLMGCLPMFLQIPVFLGLLHVLRRLRPDNGLKDIYGWSVDQFNSASLAKLFTAPISDSFNTGNAPTKVVATILVLIMTITTYMTSRQMILKTGWAQDPQQKMIQRLMLYGIPASLLFSGFVYPFPIGVVIYWVTNNLFSLAQQQWVLRKYPPPPMANTIGTTGTAKKNGGPVTQASKGGLLARFRPQPPAPTPKPSAQSRAAAPRPGAKPVNPKKGGPARRQG